MTETQVLIQLGRTVGTLGVTGAGGADEAGGADGASVVATSDGAAGLDDMGVGGGGAADFWGAMHWVQIVEVVVLMMVEMVVVTCAMGVPWGGVIVLVTGQVVKVVYTLQFILVYALIIRE